MQDELVRNGSLDAPPALREPEANKLVRYDHEGEFRAGHSRDEFFSELIAIHISEFAWRRSGRARVDPVPFQSSRKSWLPAFVGAGFFADDHGDIGVSSTPHNSPGENDHSDLVTNT